MNLPLFFRSVLRSIGSIQCVAAAATPDGADVPPVVPLLQVAATDAFPDLRVRGCAVVCIIATGTPDVFKHYAVGMVKALRSGLDHRHAKVRLATLDAVHACVTCPDRAKCKGAGTAAIHDLVAFQDPNSVPVSAFYKSDARVNYFAKLSMDANPAVRRGE